MCIFIDLNSIVQIYIGLKILYKCHVFLWAEKGRSIFYWFSACIKRKVFPSNHTTPKNIRNSKSCLVSVSATQSENWKTKVKIVFPSNHTTQKIFEIQKVVLFPYPLLSRKIEKRKSRQKISRLKLELSPSKEKNVGV